MKFEELNFNDQVINMAIITNIQMLNEKLIYSESFEDLKDLETEQLETKRDNLIGEYNILVRANHNFND